MAGANIDYSGITTQCTVMAGFFLILFIEQCVKVWQENKSQKTSRNNNNMYTIVSDLPTEVIELPDGYIASSSDNSLSEESDIDDPQKSMLHHHKPSTSSKITPKNTGLKPVGDSMPKNNTKRSDQGKISNHTHGDHSSHSGHDMGGHGHSHLTGVFETHGLRSFLLMAALGIHSLFEGMAVGLQESVMALINLFVGVLLHECLISFSVGVSLAQHQAVIKRSLITKLCVVFSATIPFGMAIGLAIGEMQGFKAELISAAIQAIAAGTFVYVIFFEILPAEISSSDKRLLKVLFMVIGFGIILCLQFSMKEIHKK